MQLDPFILGLTGSIGMGKTTAAGHFRQAGVPVFDADLAVAQLYRSHAAPLIEAAFPGTVRGGTVDHDLLAKRVLIDQTAIRRLEAIVHPLVRKEETKFLREAASAGLVVLDIPLLFETHGETRCDAVVVVSASPSAQRERVLARPGMTQERLAAILRRQMPDEEKRRRAHFVIDTSRSHLAARRQVDDVLRALAGRPSRRNLLAARPQRSDSPAGKA
ncbi:MAG: dephospho-CoA kinase [Hyphomicrobiales bacterium]|nr:dephospho-CoA kinase [Hyphomicrobiales bacterium]MBV9052175.1 dephospho-CoA kinase [Hyphomicrobiales bacterium]MBV9975219.1 dephospho-CoA kinase [Hyphomicrobiales bacterium]